MLDSRIDSVVQDLNRKFAEAVEEKSKLERELQENDLSKKEKNKLRSRIKNLEDEIFKHQENLRNRL